MLQLSTKCSNSAFNAQGSRLIIIVVHVRAVKKYVTAVEALRKKERQDETQFTTEIDGFLHFTKPPPPPLPMLMCFFAGFFTISPCVWPNSGLWCCVCLTLWITLLTKNYLKDWSKNGLKGWEPVISYPCIVKWPEMS